MRKRDLVLSTDLLTDYNLVNIIEFVPVLVESVHVAIQRFELGTSGDGEVERFRCEESFLVEQVEGVAVGVVGEECASEPVEIGHRGE